MLISATFEFNRGIYWVLVDSRYILVHIYSYINRINALNEQ